MAMMATTPPHLRKLRGHIAEAGLKRQDLAALLGFSETMFSLYLNGRRPAPADFETQVRWAMDELEEEKRVAAEAVEKLRAERAVLDAGGERL